jgi:hypothetical protein
MGFGKFFNIGSSESASTTSTTSTSSTTSNQYDRRVAATDNAVVATEGAQVSVTYADAGAIAAGKEISKASLDHASEIATRALVTVDRATEEAGRSVRASLDTAEYGLARGVDIASEALAATKANTNTAFNLVENTRKDAEERSFEQLAKWLTLAALGLAAAWAFKGA